VRETLRHLLRPRGWSHVGWALAAILLGALVLRLWGSRFGAPHLYHPDEAKLVQFAVRLLDVSHLSRDTFLKNQVYPPLTPYLYVIAFGLHGLAGLWGALGPGVSVASLSSSGAFALTYTARLVSIACAVATVGATFALGRRLYGPRVGLAAAALLAVAPLHVRDAHYATADVPATLFATLAILAAARTLEDGRARAAAWAGLAAALAAAGKYQAGVVALVVVLAITLGRRARGEPVLARTTAARIALAAGASLAAFLLLVPYPLLDGINHFAWGQPWRTPGQLAFMMSVEAEGKVGILRGAGPFPLLTGNVYEGFGFTYPNDLPRGMGVGAFLVALAATVGLGVRGLLRRRAADLVLVVMPFCILGLIQGMSYQAVRHLLPAVPCLTIAAAVALDDIVRRVATRAGHPGRAALVLGVIVALLGAEGVTRAARANFVLGAKDTRTEALEWIERRWPRGAKLALEFYGPPVTRARAPGPGPRPRFQAHDTAVLRYFGGTDRREPHDPARAVQRFGPEVVVLDSWSGHRFFLPEARRLHPRLSAQRREFYDWVESTFRLVHTIPEGPDRPGPTLRIFVRGRP
jgi:4-amino-4-deoxy-L-arabinose transferase-like glycosyltransferase